MQNIFHVVKICHTIHSTLPDGCMSAQQCRQLKVCKIRAVFDHSHCKIPHAHNALKCMPQFPVHVLCTKSMVSSILFDGLGHCLSPKACHNIAHGEPDCG